MRFGTIPHFFHVTQSDQSAQKGNNLFSKILVDDHCAHRKTGLARRNRQSFDGDRSPGDRVGRVVPAGQASLADMDAARISRHSTDGCPETPPAPAGGLVCTHRREPPALYITRECRRSTILTGGEARIFNPAAELRSKLLSDVICDSGQLDSPGEGMPEGFSRGSRICGSHRARSRQFPRGE